MSRLHETVPVAGAAPDKPHAAERRAVPDPSAAELLRTRERLELALAAANTFVFDLDLRNGRLTLHGAPRFGGPNSVVELALGDAMSNLVPEDAEALLRLTEQLRADELSSVSFEYRTGWPDQNWRWRHLHAGVVAHDPRSGRPLRLTGTSTDITERKLAELALRDREERLRVSEQRYRLAAANGHVWDWDVASGRLNVGPEFWQQLGFEVPAPESTMTRVDGLLHPDDHAPQRAALRQHLARRTPFSVELRLRDARSAWRWFHVQGQALWNDAGRATYMAGTRFDISPRKQAEAALLDLQQSVQPKALNSSEPM